MSTTKKESKKEPNDIRIGMNSRPRNVIKYATSVLEEKKLTELKFSAVGGSIGRLLDIIEVFKVLKPGFYQQNKISSVAYQTVDSNNVLLKQRLFPKLEIILSKEEPKNKTEGFQGQMDETKRKEIETILNKRKEEREKNNRAPRGRGRGRGGVRARGRRAEEIWEGEQIPGVTDIVRFAPSACNSQPWLVKNRGGLSVYRYRKPGKRGIMPAGKVSFYNRIDMGIFLCFMDICLEHSGVGFEKTLYPDAGDDDRGPVLNAAYRLCRQGDDL